MDNFGRMFADFYQFYIGIKSTVSNLHKGAVFPIKIDYLIHGRGLGKFLANGKAS